MVGETGSRGWRKNRDRKNRVNRKMRGEVERDSRRGGEEA